MNGGAGWVSDLGTILLALLALYLVFAGLRSLSQSPGRDECARGGARPSLHPHACTSFERALFGARARWDEQTGAYVKGKTR